MGHGHKNLPQYFLNSHGFHLINISPTHNTHENHIITSRIISLQNLILEIKPNDSNIIQEIEYLDIKIMHILITATMSQQFLHLNDKNHESCRPREEEEEAISHFLS